MESGKRLLVAITLSISIHFYLVAWQTSEDSSHVLNTLKVTLSPKQSTGPKEVITPLNSAQTIPEQSVRSLAPVLSDEPERPSTVFSGSVALGSQALDSPLKLADELTLEPEGGYPAEQSGQVILDLLIDEQGDVIWITTVSSDVNKLVLQFISKNFANAKFSKPTVQGRASKVLIRVEIMFGPNTTVNRPGFGGGSNS